MYKTQQGSPKKANRSNLIAYILTMIAMVVALSLLTFLGPPYGPTLQEFMAWLAKWGISP